MIRSACPTSRSKLKSGMVSFSGSPSVLYPEGIQHLNVDGKLMKLRDMYAKAWWAAVPGVAKSLTRLSDFSFHFHALEKEMATHSSVLAWRIPGTREPGGLPSMGSHRVGHD